MLAWHASRYTLLDGSDSLLLLLALIIPALPTDHLCLLYQYLVPGLVQWLDRAVHSVLS
ncbi:hypothetical protein A359_02320 [secondary endosymbiont of Ctenarytaina eucalypti]|uniref:Uncharacterized protein n=1 Tax=secondary endosymbiont of Ctenarytaina eucalypti TaxID=1199245 RepID=J3YRF7_9ENTR|nr:hypothetical protein A359_02320 [secondary endosymbiont of Ctenarytaina eucalypti]